MIKNKKKFLNALLISVFVILGCIFSGCIASEKTVTKEDSGRDVLFQVSSIDLLLAGGYDGFVSVGELKEHGGIGIGTIDTLDGELIAVDGDYYSVKSDGVPYLLSDDEMVPFADITFFEEDLSFMTDGVENISEFEEILYDNLPSQDIFYAVKFEGTFPYIKTRAVPKQEKPYPKLIEVVKNQSVFEYSEISGTVIGFWSPSFSEGMNVPGLHIHFISDDRTKGGHILDLKFEDEEIFLDKTPEYSVILSETDIGQSHDTVKSFDKNSELSLIEK
ncbi:MAG: acetolactate decarboxylase [Methanomicrobiaceae archaeon]|nr:acetolactate decarboxylase [Methanomicrobiaceae archaeon]